MTVLLYGYRELQLRKLEDTGAIRRGSWESPKTVGKEKMTLEEFECLEHLHLQRTLSSPTISQINLKPHTKVLFTSVPLIQCIIF